MKTTRRLHSKGMTKIKPRRLSTTAEEIGNTLSGWSRIIQDQFAKGQEEVENYWNTIADDHYICKNASIADLLSDEANKVIIRKNRNIVCGLTSKTCVCTYFSYRYHGYLMNDYTATTCPGFIKRAKKRIKIEV